MTKYEQILMSRSLIHCKDIDFDGKKKILYCMDTAISRIIIARNNDKNIDDIYEHVLLRLCNVFSDALQVSF